MRQNQVYFEQNSRHVQLGNLHLECNRSNLVVNEMSSASMSKVEILCNFARSGQDINKTTTTTKKQHKEEYYVVRLAETIDGVPRCWSNKQSKDTHTTKIVHNN